MSNGSRSFVTPFSKSGSPMSGVDERMSSAIAARGLRRAAA
jgi:hypothetical protein